MTVSAATFEQLALDEPNRWELHRGRLVKRPSMSMPHNDVAMQLALIIARGIDPARFRVRSQSGHLMRTEDNYFVPDVAVVPVEEARRFQGRRDLEKYDVPLPFVAEVWSPSTGGYDIDRKLPEYQRRGDFEIWRVHPFDREVVAWRRQPRGGYREARITTGVAVIASLGIDVDLAELFAFA